MFKVQISLEGFFLVFLQRVLIKILFYGFYSVSFPCSIQKATNTNYVMQKLSQLKFQLNYHETTVSLISRVDPADLLNSTALFTAASFQTNFGKASRFCRGFS